MHILVFTVLIVNPFFYNFGIFKCKLIYFHISIFTSINGSSISVTQIICKLNYLNIIICKPPYQGVIICKPPYHDVIFFNHSIVTREKGSGRYVLENRSKKLSGKYRLFPRNITFNKNNDFHSIGLNKLK